MPGSQDFAADPRNANLKVWLNGTLVPKDEAKVSVFDAGFVLGDGVWEGLRLHKGALMFLDAHIERLYRGAADIALDLGLTRERDGRRPPRHPRRQRHATRRAPSPDGDARRKEGRQPGSAQRAGHAPPSSSSPSTKSRAPRSSRKGLNVVTSTIRCTPADMFDMRLNSHSRLALIRALLDVIPKGGDEALMLDPGGMVSSCNATNFFWVKDGEVRTSTGEFCFNGVTRGNVIKLCDANAIPVKLDYFPLRDVHAADEAFVTGTFGGLTPVSAVDGHAMPTPGPVTQRLRELYDALKDNEAEADP